MIQTPTSNTFNNCSSKYTIPQHKNSRKIKLKEKSDRQWTQAKLEMQ